MCKVSWLAGECSLGVRTLSYRATVKVNADEKDHGTYCHSSRENCVGPY